MNQDVNTRLLVDDAASQAEPFGQPVGTLLGWYTTEEGRRHVRALATVDHGLCLIDDGPGGPLLIEPRLEEMEQARALAGDYIALASERGEPQTAHPWPPADSSERRQS